MREDASYRDRLLLLSRSGRPNQVGQDLMVFSSRAAARTSVCTKAYTPPEDSEMEIQTQDLKCLIGEK